MIRELSTLGLIVSLTAASGAPTHSTCEQPLVDGQNMSFWAVAEFTGATAGSGTPQLVLGMGTVAVPNGPHTRNLVGLSLATASDGTVSCTWVPDAGSLSVARTSGCATSFGNTIMFAGGHNNSAAYVGQVDVFTQGASGTVVLKQSLSLPVGRELLGCASAGNVTIFAGGKPPHPPAPIGETKEIDVWHHDTGEWSQVELSVERKKVEAIALGDEILMAGGEIGHHPPSTPPNAPRAPAPVSAPSPSPSPPSPGPHFGGYSSTVDVYNVKTGGLRTMSLSLARQYFAIAVAGGKAFFAGGFANDPATRQPGSPGVARPLAGFRSSVVDVYDGTSGKWSVMHLSTNRSNLMGTSIADRWVAFAGGTRQLPTPDLCGAGERSAVVDIYDTVTGVWSTECLKAGRTAMTAASHGNTAIFFGGPSDPIDLFTFSG